jgi:hypothetical protein
MKTYHLFFFILEIIILIVIGLISLKYFINNSEGNKNNTENNSEEENYVKNSKVNNIVNNTMQNNDVKNKILLIIDSVFKFSFGLFLIIFFLNNKIKNVNSYDKVIFIVSGFILLLLIDYIDLCGILFGKNKCYNK